MQFLIEQFVMKGLFYDNINILIEGAFIIPKQKETAHWVDFP